MSQESEVRIDNRIQPSNQLLSSEDEGVEATDYAIDLTDEGKQGNDYTPYSDSYSTGLSADQLAKPLQPSGADTFSPRFLHTPDASWVTSTTTTNINTKEAHLVKYFVEHLAHMVCHIQTAFSPLHNTTSCRFRSGFTYRYVKEVVLMDSLV